MTRRAPGQAEAAPTCIVEASSAGSFGPGLSAGRLLASVPFRGAGFAIRDSAQPAVYATAEYEHVAFDNLFSTRAGTTKALEQALAKAFGDRNVWPVDLVYREAGSKGRVRLEAIFDRSPGLP